MFRETGVKLTQLLVTFALVQRLFMVADLHAADAPVPTPYSGDIWTRSTLSGDWWGVRNDLANKGVTLDMSITQVGQGVVAGGKNGEWEYGGRGDFILNLDSGKLGLWPGGFFKFLNGGNLGVGVYKKNRAVLPVQNRQPFSTSPPGIFSL